MFLLAFLVRLGFALAWDPPLLFTHQYNYYKNGMRIAEHPDPLAYVLSSDEWRAWVGDSTIAPLYYLFLGAFFRFFGPSLLLLRVVQSAIDALVAVAAASLGRRLCGPPGLLAGIAYAFYWSAAEMTCWTMTENLHTVLLAGSLAVLARATPLASPPSGLDAAGPPLDVPPAEVAVDSTSPLVSLMGGLLLGLSGLTRSVSSAFVPVAALWRLSLAGIPFRGPHRGSFFARLRPHLVPALLLLAGGLAAVFTWSGRNRMRGDKVPIETVGFYNLWDDNSQPLLSRERYDRQLRTLEAQPTPEDYSRTALAFTARNVVQNPWRFVRKVAFNFRHFVRPDGLHNLLVKEFPDTPLRLTGAVVFDDLLLLVALPLFGAFLLGGAPSPTRRLVVTWTAYYVFMVLVIFHSETRYRSPLGPAVLAGAAAGLHALRESPSGRRRLLWTGFALGAVVSVATAARYVAPSVRALRSSLALGEARRALDRGEDAEGAAARAAALDPTAARPWRTFGRWLAARDRAAQAEAAYTRAAGSPSGFPWTTVAVRPRLLLDAGRPEEAEAALRKAHLLSWDVDPWLLLEVAWRELPAPRTDEIRLGAFDYGAVRGFHHPRGIDPKLVGHRREITKYRPEDGGEPPPGLHRWSRGTAFLRLRPTVKAATYTIRLALGSPFPSPLSNPTVEVRVGDGPAQRPRLEREVREYVTEGRSGLDGVLSVRLDAPTWGRAGEPAGQGVRVEWLRVEPKAPP